MAAANIVIVPYYSEQEIARYLKIAEQILALGHQETAFEFLLASSPRIAPSRRLRDQFSRIAPARVLACPSQVFGYPQGPTAMFWDCMDHLAATDAADGGFSLWMESDMVPVKPDWLDRLAGEWRQGGNLLVLGCFVPTLRRKRFLRRTKVWTPEHINGGACYAKDFGRQVPQEYRAGIFDLAIYPYLKQSGRYRATQSIAFSTVKRCHRDLADPRRVILHGFLQDKDLFLDRCLHPDDHAEPALQSRQTPRRWLTFWGRSSDRVEHRRERFLEALFRVQETWSLSQADTR